MAASDRKNAPSFDVEIRSGSRATAPADDVARGAARPLSPVAVRKAQTRRRVWLALGGLLMLAVLAIGVAWWVGQPPTGALARVNGEYITEAQVDKEILLNRALSALANNGQEVATTRGAVLESLISQRMQAQDATKAGVTVAPDEVDSWIDSILQRQEWTAAQLDEALKGYGLVRDDFRASVHDTVLINRYIGQVVTKGATSQDDALALQNTWLSTLQSTSQVDRYGNPDEATAPRVGATAPDFTMQDLDGKAVHLADLRGHPVLINFWATWCQPCRVEIPSIVNTYKQIQEAGGAGPGLAVVALAVSSSPDTIAAFRKEFGMPFSVVDDADNQVADLYRVGPIPTSYLIDRQGIIRWVQDGAMDESLLRTQLQALP